MRSGVELTLRDGRKVEIATLTIPEILTAMRGASAEKSDTARGLAVSHAGLRMSMRKIDGKPVVGSMLLGKLWPFRSRETFALAKVWSDMHIPDEATVEAAKAAMGLTVAEAVDRCTVTLPSGAVVVFDELTFGEIQVASRAGDREKGIAAKNLVVQLEGLAMSVRSIGGKEVTADALRAAWPLDPLDTFTLGACWSSINLGDEGDELRLPTGKTDGP